MEIKMNSKELTLTPTEYGEIILALELRLDRVIERINLFRRLRDFKSAKDDVKTAKALKSVIKKIRRDSIVVK